jgi:hypothetical protein
MPGCRLENTARHSVASGAGGGSLARAGEKGPWRKGVGEKEFVQPMVELALLVPESFYINTRMQPVG